MLFPHPLFLVNYYNNKYKFEIMTLITDLPDIAVVGTIDGTEEYVLQKGAVEYKISGTNIIKSVNDSLTAYIASNDILVNANTSGKLSLSGGTMTGFIILNSDPVAALHAATKQYVDGLIATKADAVGSILDGTATGVTAANTTESAILATTEYVGNKLNYEITKKTVIAAGTYPLTVADRGNIFVDYTTIGTVSITLPDINTLTSPERVEYYIIDSGLNSENNNITITPFAGQSINNLASIILSSNGESIILCTNGGTKWTIKDKVSLTSDTKEGLIATSTSANALLLAETNTSITPFTLGEVLENRLYRYTEIGTATKAILEADSGSIFYVTYTSGGTVSISLPNPVGGISDIEKFAIEIWDAGSAGTNSITITPSGATIDGATSFIISEDKAGLKLFTDGANYFTVANTARASEVVSGSNSLSGVLAIGNSTGTNNIDIDSGQLIRYNNGGFTASIGEPTLTGNIVFTLPTIGGILATTTGVLATAGGTMTGDLILATGIFAKFSNGGFTASIAEPTLAGNVVLTLPATTGTVALTSDIVPFVDTVSVTVGPGPISIIKDRVNVTTTGVGDAFTLVDGTISQKLKIVHIVDGGSGILTPTTLLGYTTITFNDVGDSVELQFGTGGWAIISVFNATIA